MGNRSSLHGTDRIGVDVRFRCYLRDYESGCGKGGTVYAFIGVFHTSKWSGGHGGSERTAIVSGAVPEEETQWKVKFYKNREDMENHAETYKTYQIGDGCHLQSPAEPKDGEMEFVVWKDVNDYIADFSVPVEQDQVYYAQWR